MPDAVWASLHALLEEERENLDRQLLERAEKIPAFAPLLAAALTPEGEASARHDRQITRAAMLDGDWEGYVRNLREQGRVYARSGLGLGDWYPLLEPVRTVMVPAAIRRFSREPDELAAVLMALHAWVDLAMHEIAQAQVREQAAMAEAAQGQRDLLQALFDQCPLGLAIHADADGAFSPVTLNAAFRRLASAPEPGDPPGGEAPAASLEHLRRCLETRQDLEHAYTRDGRTIEARFFPLGERHVGSVHDDVTGIRKANRSLRQLNRELERSNRDLDHFAYVASHDLKAPLRDIDNLSKWLEEDLDTELAPGPARHLERLRDRVLRMERLLDDLLQYARAGRSSGLPEPLDPLAPPASALALLVVPEGFRVRAMSAPLRIVAVPAALEIVLRNLVGNAIKHHDRPSSGVLDVTWTASGGWVTVDVADDGPGVAEEYHERIFGLFQTLRPRDRVEGSGMGLAIVRKVVESAGGTIHALPSTGRGLTVRFTWPTTPRDHDEETA